MRKGNMILSMCTLFMFGAIASDTNVCFAKHLHNEKYYQQLWCDAHQGQTEYKLIDETRVDCLTKEYAIEFDFAKKWAESIGQSLHYARLTGKPAGIVLIVEKSSDYKYVDHVDNIIRTYKLPVTMWIVDGG